MLEVAFLASHLLWMTTRQEMDTLYDMITVNAAKAMNVKDHELKVGANANLVVLYQPDVLEALREHSAPKHVISHGRVVEMSSMRSKWKQ
jgi:cytosine deaminase